MKFSTREDIDAPAELVFDDLRAFDHYERAAMRRGADIRRHAEPADPGLGTKWDVRFFLRGKEREITLEVVRLNRPEELVLEMTGRSLTGTFQIELLALSPNRTRLMIGFDVRPVTLPARLLIQSLKITKPTLDQRYAARISNYIAEMQERITGTA